MKEIREKLLHISTPEAIHGRVKLLHICLLVALLGRYLGEVIAYSVGRVSKILKVTAKVGCCLETHAQNRKSSSSVITYTIIVISFYNLTNGNGNSYFWTELFSSSPGYLKSNPSMKRNGESV